MNDELTKRSTKRPLAALKLFNTGIVQLFILVLLICGCNKQYPMNSIADQVQKQASRLACGSSTSECPWKDSIRINAIISDFNVAISEINRKSSSTCEYYMLEYHLGDGLQGASAIALGCGSRKDSLYEWFQYRDPQRDSHICKTKFSSKEIWDYAETSRESNHSVDETLSLLGLFQDSKFTSIGISNRPSLCK